MFFARKRDKSKRARKKFRIPGLNKNQFNRVIIGVTTLVISFVIIQNGAAPKKYDINLGEISQYDITATRDVENEILTLRRAEEAAAAESPVLKRDNSVPIDVISKLDDFLVAVEKTKDTYVVSSDGITVGENDENEHETEVYENSVKSIMEVSTDMGIPLTYELAGYLICGASDEDYNAFRTRTREIIRSGMSEDITKENLTQVVSEMEGMLEREDIPDELKSFAGAIIRATVKTNSIIDEAATRQKRLEVYDNMLAQKVMIKKGARVLSIGDTVTDDKIKVLEELNLIDSAEFDYVFSVGILLIIIMLEALVILYLKKYCIRIYEKLNELVVMSITVIITLLAARFVSDYSNLLIPVFIAPMLIAILLDIRLAIVMNLVLTIAVSLFTEGNFTFIVMAVISGTITPFIVSRANQRSTLSASGLLVAVLNALVIVFMGMMSKGTLRSIASDSIYAAVNGVVSIVITIGLLPFLESAFNIITPLKLLELANPNQPLIKRLLMEAPGTYHHSLMVGNLAEVATEAIGGDALLSRVGAYYHDIGKIRRPNFFSENQLAENPHDKMSPNLSTLVITSHTGDGVEMAKKHKIPRAICDMIRQHHGTTLVAYFYHKAKKECRENTIKEDDYRYHGPRPATREAAVVMLADSVEAAVRSMPDKTIGKIEGLVRKIIKDKLVDGQLDQCDITLKDLDTIANSFTKVFSGYFHDREKYPDIGNDDNNELITSMEEVEYLSSAGNEHL